MFVIEFCLPGRVSDGGLDAVLGVQRVTKAKDEGEFLTLVHFLSGEEMSKLVLTIVYTQGRPKLI